MRSINISWVRKLSVRKDSTLKIFYFQTTPKAQFKTLLGWEEVAAFGLASFTFCGIHLQCLE